jgi:hypothetical protein
VEITVEDNALKNEIGKITVLEVNVILKKSFSPYLNKPFIGQLSRTALTMLCGQIQVRVFKELKEDGVYQATMAELWNLTPPANGRIITATKSAVRSLADRVVRETISELFPEAFATYSSRAAAAYAARQATKRVTAS